MRIRNISILVVFGLYILISTTRLFCSLHPVISFLIEFLCNEYGWTIASIHIYSPMQREFNGKRNSDFEMKVFIGMELLAMVQIFVTNAKVKDRKTGSMTQISFIESRTVFSFDVVRFASELYPKRFYSITKKYSG